MTGGSHRLDAELVHRGLARSRAQARQLLDSGSVLLDGVAQRKPSTPVDPSSVLSLTDEPAAWVGRAAYKLLGALRTFGPGLSVHGRRCLDVGAGTGGFTQVLLRAGALEVVSLDVGHGQLSALVAADPRVTPCPGRNIRDVAPGDLGDAFDVVVADLSFISLLLVLEPLAAQCRPDADLVVLVKPQFEVGRERLGRSGVVSSPSEHARVLRQVSRTGAECGLGTRGLAPSPLRGSGGNQEYLLWLTPRRDEWLDVGAVDALIEAVKGPL